ncbi:MAG: hypothetical protein QM698_14100 [Micropepsaceae bacterium]
MSADHLSDAASRAATEAKRLHPWVYAAFVLAVILIVTEIGIVGIKSTAALRDLKGETFGFWQGVDAFLRQALRAAPAIALAGALWCAQDYLARLGKGELWAPSTAALVGEIGQSMTWAAAFEVVISPTILHWLDQRGVVELNLEPMPVVLGGLGVALIVIGRGLRDAVGAVGALKSEHDQFV